MAVFAAENLSCLRGQNLIFSGLRFSLQSGGALVLAGPNGSGKSSLLRVLAGLIPPFVGAVRFDDETVSDDRQAHADRMHYVGHANAIKAPLSVRENLAFWAGLNNVPGDVDRALDAFDLVPIADTPGRILSSGQRRRLNLARLMLGQRPLWLLDEPTVGLDIASCKRLEDLIAAHRAGGGMVVLSTHVGIDVPDHEVLDIGPFSQAMGQPGLAVEMDAA